MLTFKSLCKKWPACTHNFIDLGRFYDRRDAEEALDSLDGRMLDGRELRVQMARYGRPSSPYRSRYDRRGRR